MQWGSDIQFIKGVGPKRAEQLARLDVATVGDLLQLYPRGYIDYSSPLAVASAPYDEAVTLKAEVESVGPSIRLSGGRTMQKVFCSDDSASLTLVFFNNPYTPRNLKEGESYLFYGKVGGTLAEREMIAPQVLPLDAGVQLTAQYPLTEGLSHRIVSRIVETVLSALETIPEPIPETLLQRYQMPDRLTAMRYIHRPQSKDEVEQSRRRFIFEELFVLQTGMLQMRTRESGETGAPMQAKEMAPFAASLPFKLTGAQRRSIDEILDDMQRPAPMNRLLQGDVGSGKTLVAAAGVYFAALNGYQSVLMAPTEILAHQHAETLQQHLEPLGLQLALLTGSVRGKARTATLNAIEDGVVDLVVGTHAVLSDPVNYHNLGFAITDEQHRFGVRQRRLLAEKGNQPHLLVMSATPIPRTLALMLFGDLDISAIDEMPPGRKPVKTYAVTGQKRRDMFGFLAQQIEAGHQVYIVCPLVQEGESDLQAATTYAEETARPLLPHANVGLLHGQMAAADKQQSMDAFVAGETDVLVTTTVIEVGVDVPNATVMVIEDAERYGLSALHQLRGRVGRSDTQSHCILLSDNAGEAVRERLRFFCRTNDGFEIARYDLETRGPGDFFGSRQHGLPQLRIANLATDTRTLKAAQEQAVAIVRDDPHLQQPPHQPLAQAVKDMFEKNTVMN